MTKKDADEAGRWLGGQAGRAAFPSDKVEPGDKRILPDRERRKLDALPSHPADRHDG